MATERFSRIRIYPVGIETQSDGIPDIVVASVQSETVDTLLSNGDGTFQPPIVYFINNGYAGMTQIALGDINRDGILDVVDIYGYGQSFQVLAGNGDRSLYLCSHELSTGTIAYPKGLALGDFNKDGRLDVALGLYEQSAVGVSLNRQAGKAFAPPISSQAPPAPTLLALADLNLDGNLDAISTGFNAKVLYVGLRGRDRSASNWRVISGWSSVRRGGRVFRRQPETSHRLCRIGQRRHHQLVAVRS
jgi:hypothetical protein